MAKRFICECGFVADAATDDEAIQIACNHLRADHPALAQSITRSQLHERIEETSDSAVR
jgi:hypothetical protein